jgi:hypothetical protein
MAPASRWAFMQRFEINDAENGEYLHRLKIVQTPLFGVYVHRIFRPDVDRHLHDHPWWFAALILSGGYVETHQRSADAPVTTRSWRRWSVHPVATGERHKIDIVAPNTRTLILVGPKTCDWGFWTETGKVGWETYLGGDISAAARSQLDDMP